MTRPKRLYGPIAGLCLLIAGLIRPGPAAFAQSILPDAVIADSALTSEDVARHSDGAFRDRAFARLPKSVHFTIMGYQGQSAFADQLLRGLQLFADVAGVAISPPTTKLDLLLLTVNGWAEKVSLSGAAYLQTLGLPRDLAEALAEKIKVAGARSCYAVPLIGNTGYITFGVALIDENNLNPATCLPGVLFTLFGLLNTPFDDRSTDLQRLLLLREIYAIPAEVPFRDLKLEAVRGHFEFGQNTVGLKLRPTPPR